MLKEVKSYLLFDCLTVNAIFGEEGRIEFAVANGALSPERIRTIFGMNGLADHLESEAMRDERGNPAMVKVNERIEDVQGTETLEERFREKVQESLNGIWDQIVSEQNILLGEFSGKGVPPIITP